MSNGYGQVPGYERSAQRASGRGWADETAYKLQTEDAPSRLTADLHISGRGNAPVRHATMQQMQRTHGNRAVQRQVANGSNSSVAVQRSPSSEETEDAREARKVRTVIASAVRAGREVANWIAGSDKRRANAAAENKKFIRGDMEAANDPAEIREHLEKYKDAERTQGLAENSTKSKIARVVGKGPGRESIVGRGLEKITGSNNYAGMGLGLANYGLQLWQNLAGGQGVGEAVSGAAGGGYANGQMTKHLFNKSPKVGWVDAGVNVVNAGLQLAGAPEEVTTLTQTAADATPSSFGTSVVSNAGRGLWNLGDGIINGDWSGLKQQGEDLTHGKAGAPLQGYATGVEAAIAGISGDSEQLDKIREENRSGERGKLAQWGSHLGRWSRDTQDSMAEWVVDNVDFDSLAAIDNANPLAFLGGDSGPSEEQQQKNQAEFVAKREKEVADLEKNKEGIMKEQGPQAYYHKMTVANLPPQVRNLVEAAP